jgi:hypothetical protein
MTNIMRSLGEEFELAEPKIKIRGEKNVNVEERSNN